MKSSVSIALFFLLSGFFLSTLLGVLERSRKLLGSAAGCFVAVACVIIFLTPVQLPLWRLSTRQSGSGSSVTTTSALVGPAVLTTVSTIPQTIATFTSATSESLAGPQVTSEVTDGRPR